MSKNDLLTSIYLSSYRYITKHPKDFPLEHRLNALNEVSKQNLIESMVRQYRKESELTDEDITNEVCDALWAYRTKFGHGKADNKPQPQPV